MTIDISEKPVNESIKKLSWTLLALGLDICDLMAIVATLSATSPLQPSHRP